MGIFFSKSELISTNTDLTCHLMTEEFDFMRLQYTHKNEHVSNSKPPKQTVHPLT